MKVGIYAICKNERKNMAAWLDNVRDADHVTLVDTGSTDGTMQVAATHSIGWDGRCPVAFHHATVDPWRFDVAHNVALALVPPDVDICIPLSLDERLSGGWRDRLHAANHGDRSPHPTKFTYDYEFAPGYIFGHDRIHSRRGYVWRYPFHEGCYPMDDRWEHRIHVPGLKITQTQDHKPNERMARDVALAQMALAEYPHDRRMAFYVGRQYMYARMAGPAIEQLQRYFTLPGRENPWEHAAAADALAMAWRMMT